MAQQPETITVQATINAPVEKVWQLWTLPEHIIQWNAASADWHSPKVENDLREGGKFTTRMEARDGSFGFDFGGTYTQVKEHALITYRLDDNREVSILFNAKGDDTEVTETFGAEETHTIEQQRTGWQAILDNFKRYAEELA